MPKPPSASSAGKWICRPFLAMWPATRISSDSPSFFTCAASTGLITAGAKATTNERM